MSSPAPESDSHAFWTSGEHRRQRNCRNRYCERSGGVPFSFSSLGTAGAALSPMVQEEVQRFARPNRFRSHRPILPINIAGAFDRVQWSELTGLHRAPEAEEARTDGRPSEAVIRLIQNSYTFTRRNQRVRGLSLGAVVLLLAAIGVSIYATQQRKTASAAKQEAQTSQIAADVAARSAKEQEQLARQNAERANENARQSELHAAEARDNAAKAESQRRLTEQQTGIAEARLLAVEANLARAQRPELLSRSVLLGIEAIRKFPSAETDQALRQGLDLLPRRIGVFKHDDDVIAVAFSRDGKRLATTGRIHAVQMWDAGSREAVGSQVKYSEAYGPVNAATLSPNWEFFAAATRISKCASGASQTVVCMCLHSSISARSAPLLSARMPGIWPPATKKPSESGRWRAAARSRA